MALEDCSSAIVVHVQPRQSYVGSGTVSESSTTWPGQLGFLLKSSTPISSPTTLTEPHAAMIHETLHGRATELIAGFYVVPELMPLVLRTRAIYYAYKNDGERVTLSADILSTGCQQSQSRASPLVVRPMHKLGGVVAMNEDQALLNMHEHLQSLHNRKIDPTMERVSR